MTPNILKTNVSQSQSAGFFMAQEALEILRQMLPVNAQDGASSSTVQRRPLSIREGQGTTSDYSGTLQSYRLQTTIGTTSYVLYQGATNWMLDSPIFEQPVDTLHPKEDEVHLVQANGEPIIFKVAGGVTAEIYSTTYGSFETYGIPSALATAQSISVTTISNGEVLATDGVSVYAMNGNTSSSFPLTTTGSQFVIESLGDKAICWTSNGSVSTFHTLTPRSVESSHTSSETGSYRGSSPLPNGVAVYLESSTHFKCVQSTFSEVDHEYTIAKTDIVAAGIDDIDESIFGVYWYRGGVAEILSVTLVADSGSYFLRKRYWDGAAIGASEDLHSYSDANTSFTEILGSVDIYTWGSRTTAFLGETITIDHSYIPAKILTQAEGEGGQSETDTLQTVTDRGEITTNNITVNGLTATTDPIDAQGDLRAQSNVRFDLYGPVSGHNLLIVGTDGTLYTRSEDYYTTEGWVTSQGYATQTWVNQQNFATQSFVTSQGYVDENLSSLSFNTSDGVLTASLSGGTQTTVDLDGRYLQSVSLNDLTDVDAASNKSDGAVMQWSSVLNRFVLSNTLDLRIEGSDLLADNSPTAGQVYQYNGTTFQWATVTSGGVTSLNDIGDVSVASPNTNDVLTWNGSTWVASAAGGGAADGVVTGATFASGTLTLTRSLSLSDVTVNLDGRYLQSYTETDPTGIASMSFSGSSTKTLTINRNNGTTVTASFTDLQGTGGGSVDGVVNGGSYNNGTGALTLTRTESLSDVIIQMGGGFMTNFFVAGDTTASGGLSISNGNTLTIKGDTNGGIYTNAGFANDTVRIGIEDEGVTTARIANEAVTEAKIDIHNAPTTGNVLGYTANGLEWVSQSGGGGSADGVVSGATFNTSNGILSLSRTEGLSAVTVDLDGRYKRTAEFTFIGDVSNGAADNLIESGETFAIKGVGGITTAHGLNANELLVTIPLNSIQEDRLLIANSPQDGEVLSYDSGGMAWTLPPAAVRAAECSVNTSSSAFTPSNAIWSKVAGWGSVTSFGTSFVSQASNTFTVSEDGVYEVYFSIHWEASSSSSVSYIQSGISINGATPPQSKRRGIYADTSGVSQWVDVIGVFDLSANDDVTLVHFGDANSASSKIIEAHVNLKKIQ